ncbi:MAG: NAD(P)H-hydrate dehydratase [Tannerellaceae bacterium]|jgi:NAD(P)H-hydrate epimerase|nr:NAD(P)H-hydrate dehydratase [Tannerellaceae bacterium]
MSRNTERKGIVWGREEAQGVLRRRERNAHKGMFGHALLVAGSKGKIGAALLAATACMRSGVGVLTVHLPGRGETALHTALPEAMISPDAADDHFSEAPSTDVYAAVGLGPGLGQASATRAAMLDLLSACRAPLVVDADGLNILAGETDGLHRLAPETILTPHPKEFDRLVGDNHPLGRERRAGELAREYGLVVVLKGGRTTIHTPMGETFVHTGGNPRMATAGSGDVLTGIILGLLAQGYVPEEAALLGVYLHGAAGGCAAAAYSEEAMLAGDICRNLGEAFRSLREDTTVA